MALKYARVMSYIYLSDRYFSRGANMETRVTSMTLSMPKVCCGASCWLSRPRTMQDLDPLPSAVITRSPWRHLTRVKVDKAVFVCEFGIERLSSFPYVSELRLGSFDRIPDYDVISSHRHCHH